MGQMGNESAALARPPPAAAEEDYYQSLSAVLSESARGRAFLAEYARRNRQADTEMLLAALERLETRLHADSTALARMRDELRVLLIAIRLARPEIDAASAPDKTPDKAANLARLLDLVERRIDAMVEDKVERKIESKFAAEFDAKIEIKPTELATPAEAMIDALALPEPLAAQAARARLAVVPPPEQPELPIPSPAAAPPKPFALVPVEAAPANPARTASIMPEVNLFDSAPVPRKTLPAAPAPAPIAKTAPQAAAAPSAHPLALIMALSEDERIALFT